MDSLCIELHKNYFYTNVIKAIAYPYGLKVFIIALTELTQALAKFANYSIFANKLKYL
ncbi:hypothetical protein GCM10010832_13150 [Psychroflexus planctonicus]|uniref:Uncharacterized protein n=1 Tax=Psychroflexus planctonicus TaxID=1526575 RepID=A0ABQ1SIF6_9FLAO|nr:hypothetical protein GCM10010832_13150 [Psychroflexus planctonicus]